MGDFIINATILPSETASFSPNGKENRNSPLFEEFLSRANFRTVNTMFRKHRSNLISFNGPNKRSKVTLDYYILLNQSEVDYIMSAILCHHSQLCRIISY